MHVPEWHVTQLGKEIDNTGYKSDLEYELFEMQVDLKAKALFKSKNLSEYQQYQYCY